LLQAQGIRHTTVTGDLRYDRVMAIAKNTQEFPQLEAFLKDAFVVIGGSTWEEEEKILLKAVNTFRKQIKLIIVPHDISAGHLQQIEKQLEGIEFKRFSNMKEGNDPQILLVDTIGQLSSLYKLANVALVGGGFTGALHNILEPAVFGIPVVFGSTYHKFPEAAYFVEKGQGIPINSSSDFNSFLKNFMQSDESKEKIKSISASIFKANSGGTEQVFFKIKGLLSHEI
jgi:3-deoxy-D-manno-octulosonic-acid transferase